MLARPRGSPLFPYTTLFRSEHERVAGAGVDDRVVVEHDLGVEDGGVEPNDARGARLAAARTHERERERVRVRSEEHTSELQSHVNLVCRLLRGKKNTRGTGL